MKFDICETNLNIKPEVHNPGSLHLLLISIVARAMSFARVKSVFRTNFAREKMTCDLVQAI